MRALSKAFHIVPNGGHIEIHNTGARSLPFATIGYCSYFVPLSSFRDNKTVKNFDDAQFPKRPNFPCSRLISAEHQSHLLAKSE